MSKITHRQNGIALLGALLLAGSMTITGWGKALYTVLATEAHISDVTLGHDKKMTDPTDEFGVNDTIFAAVDVEGTNKTVKVIGKLHVVEIAGLKPGPIQGLDVTVTLNGEGTADFSFSKPTKGWPVGKYNFEALLIDEKGEAVDTESHEFIVH